jgi:hypothetical protein
MDIPNQVAGDFRLSRFVTIVFVRDENRDGLVHPALFGVPFARKSGLMNKHIVKHIVTGTGCLDSRLFGFGLVWWAFLLTRV